MKKSLIVLSVFVAACGGGSSAAIVDGKSVSSTDVEAYLPDTDGTVETVAFRNMLQFLVIEEIILGSAEKEFGITADDAPIEEKLDLIKAQVGAADDVAFYETAAGAGFSAEGVRALARQQVIRDAVAAKLLETAEPIGDDELRAVYDENLYRFIEEACVSHILLAGEAEAIAAKTRIEDGDDFGVVATELSTDPSAATNSGDLGCGPLDRYVPEFANAALTATIGEVTDPVESQFGFHLILVSKRSELTPFEDAKGGIIAQLEEGRSSTIFDEWLITKLSEAVVTVDARYGSWSTDPSPQILPPTTVP